jgi:Ribonuclease HII
MRVLQKILRPTLEFENAAYNRGFSKIAGIDEAGRGPLAGPVFVAAVILGKSWNPKLEINDSKQLPAKKREELFELIRGESKAYKIVSVSPLEIDRVNILQAHKGRYETL